MKIRGIMVIDDNHDKVRRYAPMHISTVYGYDCLQNND
jgi:hypothetical protein